MEILSVEGAKSIDRATISDIGIPSIVLMENAAQEIFNNIVHKGKDFFIVCGEGNNGGDGLAIARKLIIAGKRVTIAIVGNGNRRSYEFTINYNILQKLGADIRIIKDEESINIKLISEINNSDIIIDALFGVGLNREVEGKYYKMIQSINQCSKHIVSVDVSSGINCNNGEVLGIAVKANETYTIEVYKKGFLNYKAKEYLGEVKIIKIGIPNCVKERYSESMNLLCKDDYKNMLPRREKWGHKGNYGRVLILAGSNGFIGAAYITVEAAVRTGSGLVTLLVNDEIYPIIASKFVEAMVVKYSEIERINNLIKNADVIACGPGLGWDEVNISMLEKCILESKCPIVLDADGLNALNVNKELLNQLRTRAVFTPHPGEMATLIDKRVEDVEKDRIDICKSYAKDNNIVNLLKGYNTIISNGEKVIVNTTGSSKMASGGMGDCLTGVIASLIGQGMDIFQGTVLGCYVHGLAGDNLGKERYSVNARDVIEEIPKILEDMLLN